MLATRQDVHPESDILDHLLGELRGQECAAVCAHLRGCATCRALEQEWRDVLAAPVAAGGRARGTRRSGRGACLRLWGRVVRPPAPASRLEAPSALGRSARGLARCDDVGQVRVAVRGLPTLPLGGVYVVWRADEAAWRNVGALAVDARGGGGVRLPAASQEGKPVMLTPESDANAQTPSGRPVLVGHWP